MSVKWHTNENGFIRKSFRLYRNTDTFAVVHVFTSDMRLYLLLLERLLFFRHANEKCCVRHAIRLYRVANNFAKLHLFRRRGKHRVRFHLFFMGYMPVKWNPNSNRAISNPYRLHGNTDRHPVMHV